MTGPVRALCLHGHYYQPPRQHPWLGVVEPDASAAPARDWNTRITAECYAPNAAARVLDAAGRLVDVVDLYRWTSFDFGPTLLAWLAGHAPDVLSALRAADARSRARSGHGNAWAQAYGHAILPLSTARDFRATCTDTDGTRMGATRVVAGGETSLDGELGRGHLRVPFDNIVRITFQPVDGERDRVRAQVQLREGEPVTLTVRSSTTFYGQTPGGAYQIRARDLRAVDFSP